jgi:hypothetical protein
VFASRRESADAADGPAAPAPDETATAHEAVPDGAIAVSRTDLTFTAGALLAFAAYAVFVAAGDVTPLSIGVAGAVVATLGLVVFLRQSIPAPSTTVEEPPVPVADGGDDAPEQATPAADAPEVDA